VIVTWHFPGSGADSVTRRAARVRTAIADLADGQRDAVLLFYLKGLSHREVAAELGVSVGAVKSRLHQARAALAPRLAPLIDIKEEQTMTATAGAPEWIDVTVAEVRREDGDPGARKHVMVLEAADGRGRLPIWVGPAEASALALALEAVETPRPLTYQMTASLLEASGARLTEARITRLDGGTFYAVLIVDGPGGPREVDARPSDAVTLALVVSVPVRAGAGLFADADAADCPDLNWRAYPTGTAELAAETEKMRRERQRRQSR
jgi:bifunctional DNase/RNase